MIHVVGIKFLYGLANVFIASLVCLYIIIANVPTASAEPEADLIIESNLRYLFGTGGGEVTITVQGDLAREIRYDIFEEYLSDTNDTNVVISKVIADNFAEAFEDLLELRINPNRQYYDKPPNEANVSYKGNYKIIKLSRVDIQSIDGLEGTKSTDSSRFEIELDLKGELLQDSEIILSDGYIILYALWGEAIPSSSYRVEESSTITVVGMDSFSNQRLDSGGEISLYRIGLGENIVYNHEYKLNGYELDDEKKDTASFDSFNVIFSPLILIIIIFIFTIISSMIGKYFVNKYNLQKVLTLRILAGVLFLLLVIIYIIGIDAFMVWGLTIVFFVINVVLAIGVYSLGWGNMAKVTVRHEDFLKAPPRIEEGPWHERGISNAKVGNFVEAIDCFENALESEPGNAIIWNDLGFVLRKIGKYQKAMDCFNKALELRPEYTTAMENLEKTKQEMMAKRRGRRNRK